MINFFRKIRYGLMEKNKTGKYLKYAIGEIVLVVIGILIALQVNDWNNDKIDNTKIKASLQNIHNEIVKDSVRLVELIEKAKKEVNHNNIMNDRAKSKEATLDTLIKIAKYEFRYFWVAQTEYSDDGYESIKSSSYYEKIPNTLKIALSDFYNNQNNWINIILQTNTQYRERLDDFTKTYSPTLFIRGEKKYTFINSIGWTNVNPRHFNPRFNGILGTRLVLYINYLQGLEEVQIKSRDLIAIIKPYLHD